VKKLKLYNGRLFLREKQGHGYIAAYSDEDAIRLLDLVVGGRGNRTEIKKYWSKDAWGNQMDGITPSRGVWWVSNDERWGATPSKIYDGTDAAKEKE